MVSYYPSQFQAIYSELLNRVQQAELEGLIDRGGAFAAKEVKGKRYWYFRRRAAGRIVERYIGPETQELLQRIELQKAQAEDAKSAAQARRELVRTLRGQGYPFPDQRTGRVLEALAVAGVFRLHGCLVGTHAFRCYPAMLGVRLPEHAALTTDVDLAQFRPVSIAVRDQIEPAFGEVLAEIERFTPLPTLKHRTASFSWRTTDRSLEIELLTPMVGPTNETLVKLPALRAHAMPVRFLDYLIEETDPAVVIHGSGVLVNVPRPERYALHKLIVSQRRTGANRSKSAKDIDQAAALIRVLGDGSPDELMSAWQSVVAHGPNWRKYAIAGYKRLPEDAQVNVRYLVEDASN